MPGYLPRAIIFDADDTLWHTQELYGDAIERFCDALEGHGFERDRAADMLAATDSANAIRLGFSRHRFPASMEEVYHALAQQMGRPISRPLVNRVRAIGYSVYERTPRLMDDAAEVLEQLKRSYTLYLYTAGDRTVQDKKLRASRLVNCFTAVAIVDQKTDVALRHTMAEWALEPRVTWMVGNSPRSDINPALRQGLRCIWMRGAMWQYDQEPLGAGPVWSVPCLRHIPPLVASVDVTDEEGGGRLC